MKNILILSGGLGNQMFEYAFLLALRQKGHMVIIDTSYYDYIKMHNGYELERVFGIQESQVNRQGVHVLWLRVLNKFRPQSLYMVDNLQYDFDYVVSPKKYIWGYWQDERYFKSIESKVRTVFQFRGIDKNNLAIAHEMRSNESVSLHVRRGDYAAFGMNLMGEDYYQKSVEYIKEKVDSPFFYVFSDDDVVAKTIANNMGISYKLINHNKADDSYKDMFLMSQCKHNIIANSSFSWWGAWLNENSNKIIVAPRSWDEKRTGLHPQVNGWVLI